MESTKIITYHTKTGKIGADVFKQSSGGYRYTGAWGAGCISAEDMKKQMRLWEATKRGFIKEVYPTEANLKTPSTYIKR